MTLKWPNRIVASGYVSVQAGAPSIVGSAGIVASVTDLGVGEYRINLRSPGVPYWAIKGGTAFATPISATFANATCELASATQLIVRVFDAAGAALDASFVFAVMTVGTGVPAPAPPPPPPPLNPYPGYAAFDLDYFETELNTLLAPIGANIGTATKPTPPTLPQGVLTPVTAVDAASFSAACALGGTDITLDADLTGVVSVDSPGDVLIRLDGHTIDIVNMGGFGGTGVERMQIVGPGVIGSIGVLSGGCTAIDLLIDGVWLDSRILADGDNGVPFGFSPFGGAADGNRIGIVNCLLSGYDGTTSIGCASLLAHAHNVVFANCNMGAGLNTTGFNDDWGYRQGDVEHAVIVDSYIQSKWKNAVRQGDVANDGQVLWSSPTARGTDRRTTMLNRFDGNMEASIQAGGVCDTLNIIRMFTRWIMAQEGGAASLLWGPSTVPGSNDLLYLIGGTDVRATSAALFDATTFSNRQAAAGVGQIWNLNCLGAVPNTFTYADPIDPLVPAWPTVNGGESIGTSFLVGSDPYA